ncbi:MAG: hypothetical protein C4B58_14540 [Deltaproteobacteria bacterium]|nr:MAG: hypothetical protein C4B58_14540 [Deltaproteobacteria bacterium]
MSTDTKQQIETALWAFSGAGLRATSIGLLNSLGYQSKKTLNLDNTPEANHALTMFSKGPLSQKRRGVFYLF